MPELILFNKPFRVMSQFRGDGDRDTLANYIKISGVYPAGRLDYDSEGLMVLTGDGLLQHSISHPDRKLLKTYWVQVEGEISETALQALNRGVKLKDGLTKPAVAKAIPEPAGIWERSPPIRNRKNIPTSWVALSISEGRNRQVRRMTAAVGFPTLRLIRCAIGDWNLAGLAPGHYRRLSLSEAQYRRICADRAPADERKRPACPKKPAHRVNRTPGKSRRRDRS